MKKLSAIILSCAIMLMCLVPASASNNTEDGKSFLLPELVVGEGMSTFVPNAASLTASPDKDGIVAHVSNIGVDTLDSVTVTATITDHGTQSLTAPVPPLIGKNFTFVAPMTKCYMDYDLTLRVIDGSGTSTKTGSWEYNYTEEILAAMGWGAGTYATRGASLEYHFNKHHNDTGVKVDNLVDYLALAIDTFNDTLTNPEDYTITVQPPKDGFEPAHKYKHSTTGLFIIYGDNTDTIYSFGGK